MSKKKYYDDDDGETIVNMDVEGMPWYDRRIGSDSKTADGEPVKAAPGMSDRENMTKEELRAYRFAALKAALFVAVIFGAAYAAFIAFCDFVWFN